jgi:hypothetical protein
MKTLLGKAHKINKTIRITVLFAVFILVIIFGLINNAKDSDIEKADTEMQKLK